jgi:predicted membrane channel-forming protein YqfA (hemolysin III family)
VLFKLETPNYIPHAASRFLLTSSYIPSAVSVFDSHYALLVTVFTVVVIGIEIQTL